MQFSGVTCLNSIIQEDKNRGVYSSLPPALTLGVVPTPPLWCLGDVPVTVVQREATVLSLPGSSPCNFSSGQWNISKVKGTFPGLSSKKSGGALPWPFPPLTQTGK